MPSHKFSLFNLVFTIGISKKRSKVNKQDPYLITIGEYYTSKDDPGEIVIKVVNISSSEETIYWTLYKYGKTYYTPSVQENMRTNRAVFFSVYEPYGNLNP